MSDKICKNCDNYDEVNLAYGRCPVRQLKLGENVVRGEWWGCDYFNIPIKEIEKKEKKSGKRKG